MATQIGIVKTLTGEVTATAADGSIRTLQVGDMVYANELISTGQAGAVEIEFADGSIMDLGRSSQAMLDSAVFDPSSAVADASEEDVPDDVAAIQQALLEGEDPTEVGEATAAGAGVEGGNEGHEAVFVDYLNPEVTPDAGFETIGVTNTIDEYIDEQLIDGVPTAGLITVELDEDDLGFFDSEAASIAFNNLISGIQGAFQSDTGYQLSAAPHFGVGDSNPGDDLPSPNPTFFSGALNADYGLNGPGSISFNPVVSQPTGLTSGGQPIQIWVSPDGLTLIGYIAGEGDSLPSARVAQEFDGAEIIFSAQIDPTTLNFSAGIYGPVDHPDTAETGSFEENLLINMAFTITDADGDAAQGIVRLNVDDDSPVIGEQSEQPFPGEGIQEGDYPYGPESALVDEDDTENGVGNTDSLDDNNGPNTIALPINFGADGPAEVSEVSTPVLITGISGDTLTSNGQPVVFQWNNATSTFEGTVDGEPVINIHVDVYENVPSFVPGSINGVLTEVSVELIGNLDHPQGADGEVLGIEDNLNINVEYTASDADGDQVDGSFDLSIDDDMPVIGTPEAVSVDEEGIKGNAGDSYDADATVNGVLFMPELENGDLNSALDTDAKQAIKSFVEAGGQLVINGSYGSEDESLLNDIFGFSITNGSNTSSNDPTFSQTGAVTGTDFESGPAQLNNPNGTYTWDISSLPAEATVMYSDGDDAAVVTIPVGDGQITFLAYDWFDAAPTGSQDGGWTDILDIAVSANGSPAEISVFDNGSYVDTNSGGVSAESDNVQDTLQSQGHNVSTFTGITLADILAALPEFSTGDLAGEETVASGSLAINWGADDNNDAESDYDRSVVFSEQSAPEGLTADGQPVTYTISEDGTMLTAFTGEQGTDSYTEVFTVSLSDVDNGSYTFTLLGNLDHPEANTEDDINLNFSFIATDSDGDSAAGSFAVTIDDDAPVASGESVEFTVDEDDINTGLSEGNQVNDGNDDGSFTGSSTNPFDNGPSNVSGSVAALVSFGADGAGGFTLGNNFDALMAQNLTSQGDAVSYSADGNVLTAEADGREVFTLTLNDNGDFTFALNDQLDHADADGQNNLPLDLSSVIVATDADGDAITLDSGFTINITDDVPEQAGLLPEVGIVEDEALPGGNQEINDFIETIDLGIFGTYTIAVDGWPDTAIATGSLADQVSIGADDPATFSLSGDFTQLISQNLTSGGEQLSYTVDGDTLYAVASQNVVFTLKLEANGDYTFTLMGPLDHADGILEENVLPIDFSALVDVTDADGDMITLDQDFYINVVDDSPEVGNNAVVRLDDDALTGGNPGGPGDNVDAANVTGTLDHSFGADGGSIGWKTSGAPNGFSYETNGDDLLIKQDGETVLTLTLDPQTGDYTVTQNAPIEHRDNGNNNENNQIFNVGYLVTDGDGDTADGALRINVDDDTPTVEPYEVNTMRIISDDDSVAGLNGNPGGIGDSNQYNLNGTLQFSAGADGGTVAWNVANSSSDGGAADVTFSVDGDGSLILTQMQNGVAVQVAKATLDENTGEYSYTQTANLLHTPGGDENNADFTLGFTVTDGDGDEADGHLVLRIDDDTPTVADFNVNTMRIISDDDTIAGLNGNPGEGSNTTDGAGTDSKEYNQSKTLQFSVGADGGTVAWNVDNSSVDDGTQGVSFSVNDDGSLILTQMQGGVPVEIAVVTLDENTGDYTYTQTGNLLHTAGDSENNALFTLGFTVTDGDGDTADGHLTLSIDDDTPTVADYNVNTMRIISDDDTVAGLNGNPGEGTNTTDGAGTDSKEYNQSKTLQFSAGADGGTVAWNVDNSSVDDDTAGVSFSVNDDGSLVLTQMQDGVPVEIAVITLDPNTGDYDYTQTGNLLHTAGDNENNAAFTLGFTVTDGDGDTADGHLTLLIDDDSPVVTSQQINLLTESFENFAPDLSGNNWTVVGEGGGTIIGNNGIEWTVNGAGIEIQSGNVGGANASDGDVHAELDAHDSNDDGGSTLTKLSTEVDLPTADATLSFDFQPRPSDVDGSDMAVSLGGQIVSINVDGAGVIDFVSLPAGESATQTSSADGWTTITLTFTGLDTGSAQTLTFEGVGSADTLGAYLDNISLNAVASLTVDESVLADGNGEAGASASASYDFSAFFSGEFGADGAGDESFSLNLNGSDVASGLYAVDNADTSTVDGDGFGQGNEIVLNQSGNVITGSADGVDYFTISVNPDTGEVTLTQLENIWHADTTNPDDAQGMMLDAETLNLIKTLTDADGDSAEASLDLSGVNFNFEDDAPVITAEQPTQPFLITVTNEGGDAGYNNTYGFYIKGDDGQPESGQIIWSNVKEHVSDDISVDATDPSDIGFFIIPDGANLNVLTDGAEVTFQQDGDGWQVVLDGTPLSGQGTNALFDNADLNPGNTDAVQDNGATGNQNWEDIIGGDNDFNDVNINVSISQLGALTVDETDIGNGDPSSATASLDLSGSFDINYGADGEGSVSYSLAVADDAESGLVDTISGKTVELRVNGDGEVEGFITTDDNVDLVVFNAGVDENGELTLTQYRAVEHDDPTDADEANSPATVNPDAIILSAIVTDADGDSASSSIDAGVLFAFEDDGPTVGEQSEANVDEGDSTTGQLVFDAGQDGGEVTAINGISLSFGQDGFSQEIELDHGTLQVKANGEFTYSVDSGAVEQDEVENFNFTVTDGDGDTAQGAVAITIVNALIADVVTLNDVTVNEGDGTATITGSVENPVTGSPLVITLNNGTATITIDVGETTGTSTPFSIQGDDPYVDGETITVNVTETTGGNYSSLDTSDSGTITVDDTIDITSVALTAAPNFTEDGTSLTYTLTLGNEVRAGDEAVTVNFTDLLGNAQNITINSGDTGTVNVTVPESAFEDVYAEADADLTVATNVTVSGGSDFENLGTPSVGTVELSDTIDTVTATLTTSTTEVDEDGGDITYTVTLSGGPGDIDPDSNLVFNLANGDQVTILAGQTSGSVISTYADGDITNQTAITNSITGVAAGGSEYENLQTTGTTSVDVDYTPEISDLTPAANGGDVTVDEDDLTEGSDTSKESTTQEGTFTISSGDAIDELTIDGHAVITNGTFSTTSFTTTALGNTLSVTGYDANTGEITYTYELADNTLNHGPANNGENGVFENLAVSLSDVDGDVANDTLSVQIIDDVPTAVADSVESEEGSSSTLGSDLVLMIDTSGSVSNDDLDSMKASLQTLFNSGSVHSVFVTSFASDGEFHDSGVDGGWYTDLDAAMSAINSLSSGDQTDYDAALEAVTDNFTPPPAGGDQLVSMFISDGEPNQTNGSGSYGIDSGEEAAWIQFLEANGFNNSYAVGYNGLGSGDISELEPIAWTEGESSSTNPGADDDNVIILDEVDDLSSTLSSTVTATPNPVTGNVLDNDNAGADGYGSPALFDVTYDGNTVTFSGSTTSATFNTDAGTVVINSDGSYEFTGLAETDSDISATIGYTVQDADGDQSSSNLVVTTEVAGELYVGSNQDNTHQTAGGDDVLIGDLGGQDQQYSPGSNYSIALIADESGSMSGDRLELLQDALEAFVNDLADHDGVINIGLIGFGESANLQISVDDLANNPDGLDDLLDEISDLSANGGTNYEDAFNEAVDWFSSQPSGHEFITYFMTDGDPTYSNSGSNGSGSSTNYEDLYDAVQAFQALSAISEVNAIGIGNGVNTDYLRFFDNTNNAGTGNESFGSNTTVLANFQGNSNNEELESGWDESADSDPNGEFGRSSNRFFIKDQHGNGATIVTSAAIAITVADSAIAFDVSSDSIESGDQQSWSLEQKVSGVWTTLDTYDFSQTSTGPLDEGGIYRLKFTVNDLDEGGIYIPFIGTVGEDSEDYLYIDNIVLNEPDDIVTGPVGEPQVINTAGELTAQLQTGNTTEGPADLGDDVLQGGEGDDVIFGDTLFTDDLTWTNTGTGETFSAGHGLGYEGLVEYLTWAVNSGTAPDDAQIMQYIRDNYEDLINPNPTQAEIDAAGDDTLIGGGGNDILIGGEGADIFQWNEGDEGTAASPAYDVVTDFSATEGDSLNLADLLQGEESGNIEDYISVAQDGDNVVINVTPDGAGGDMNQVITLQDTTVDQLAGGIDTSSMSQADIINTLISNGQLNVDQS